MKTSPDFTTKSRTKMMTKETTKTQKLAGSTTSMPASSTRAGFTTKPKTKLPDTTTKKLGGQTVQSTTDGKFTTQSKTKIASTKMTSGSTKASIDSRVANQTTMPVTKTTPKKAG